MNKFKINGSYTEKLNYLQEHLNPEDLEDYQYLKQLKYIQINALKAQFGKNYEDPLCKWILINDWFEEVKEKGLRTVLDEHPISMHKFVFRNYITRILNNYGPNVINYEDISVDESKSIKERVLKFKQEEAKRASKSFRINTFINGEKARYMDITLKKLLEAYYEGFEYTEGDNTTSIKKQLRSQNIAFREQDLVTWGEVAKWFKNYYIEKPNLDKNYHFRALLLDTQDERIPSNFKKWAFCDSCYKKGGSGEDSPKLLDGLGAKMLKFYCLSDQMKLVPSARTFYFKKGENLAFSGTYCGYGHREMAKTGYSFTKAIMCMLYHKRFEDFDEIDGLDTNNEVLNNEGYNIYLNMADSSGYKKFGTANFLKGISVSELLLLNLFGKR